MLICKCETIYPFRTFFKSAFSLVLKLEADVKKVEDIPPSAVELDLTEEAPHEPLQAVTDEDNDHQMKEEDDDDDDDGDDSGSVYQTETETTESELEEDEKEKPG